MTAQRDSTSVDWLDGVTFQSRVYHILRNGMKISVHNLSYSGCGISGITIDPPYLTTSVT